MIICFYNFGENTKIFLFSESEEILDKNILFFCTKCDFFMIKFWTQKYVKISFYSKICPIVKKSHFVPKNFFSFNDILHFLTFSGRKSKILPKELKFS